MQIITMLSTSLKIHELTVNNLNFADDTDLMEGSLARLQESLELVT